MGLTLRHDRGRARARGPRGGGFGLRDCLDDRAGRVTGTASRVGRRGRSELWLQIVAGVLELPLERAAVDEGAAFGAALLGGVAAPAWRDVHAAVRATVRIVDTIEPVPAWGETLDAQLHDYLPLGDMYTVIG